MKHRTASLLALIPAALLAGNGLAQDDDPAEPTDEASESEAIDEIVVRASRDGDPKKLELEKAEMLRAQVFALYREMKRDEEESEWRSSLPKAYGNFGGIKWGYDANAESRMRRESGLDDMDPDEIRPATIIRIEF
ncbi:MAG: hypothetical protein QNJ19_06155 [Woeseiaceae bacterium]|nr:hypothetical protein [Woeseiaceae bacterium]